VGDLSIKNELPSTFKAYCYQQHRWSCGPANFFRKMVMEILRNKVNNYPNSLVGFPLFSPEQQLSSYLEL
jgi:hypothetical protein